MEFYEIRKVYKESVELFVRSTKRAGYYILSLKSTATFPTKEESRSFFLKKGKILIGIEIMKKWRGGDVDLDGRKGGEALEGVVGEETLITIYDL